MDKVKVTTLLEYTHITFYAINTSDDGGEDDSGSMKQEDKNVDT